jgi:hypothetical protein
MPTPYSSFASKVLLGHLAFAISGLLLVSTGFAQNIDPSRLREASSLPAERMTGTSEEEMKRRDLGEENGFASASEADDDLGQQLILKETPKNRPFRTFVDEFGLWSNNAANVASGERTDWMYGTRIGVGWQQQLASHWYADVGLTQGLYRYRKTSALDFEAMEAMASILDVEPRFWNTVLVGSFGFTRITNNSFNDSLLNSLSGRLAAQRLITFDRKNSLQVALTGDWDITNDVEQVFRDEYSLDVRTCCMSSVPLSPMLRKIGWKFTPLRAMLSMTQTSTSSIMKRSPRVSAWA